ncbi:AAA family ATPase [Pseudomonas poae]|nr:AAA family ATPase [Pseudomonas poae]
MQYFERSSVNPPVFLSSKEVVEARSVIRDFLLLAPNERSQTATPVSEIDLDDGDMLPTLSRLFRGKCAFCERFRNDLRHHRFRPVANALPTKKAKDHHLYYSWLSLAWENIYPVCRECVPHRIDFFPVNGPRQTLPTKKQLDNFVKSDSGLWGHYPLKEQRLYLDPCSDQALHEHLHVNHEGVLHNLSVEGSMTIQAYNLDRPKLTKQRSECLSRYLDLFLSQERDAWINHDPSVIALLDFPALEFGGLWYLQCRQIAMTLSTRTLTRSDLSMRKILKTFSVIAGKPGFQSALKDLRETLFKSNFGFDSQWAALREEWVGPQVELEIEPAVEPDAAPMEYGSLYAFELKNFKSIEHLKISIPKRRKLLAISETSAQVPALLILGENAVGKSSVLEALALALADNTTRRRVARNHKGLTLNTSLLGAVQKMPTREATVTLRLQPDEVRVLTITNDILEVNKLSKALPPVFAYGPFRQYLNVNAQQAPAGSIFNLFDSTRLLANPEAWLRSLNKNDFEEVVRVLRIIFSMDKKFKFIEEDEVLDCLVIVTNIEDNLRKGKTPLHLASSGYRSLLAMVCDILRGLMDRKVNPYFQNFPTAQAVVLIDEIEVHLHPHWKIRIMSALREALPKVTFIATSHDPLCLRGMHKGEVAVLRRRANVDDDLCVKIECISDLPDVGKLTVEQLLTSDFFNLMTTDEPDMQLQLAHIADLLAKQEEGDSPTQAETEVLKKFKREILDVLPVGSTEAQRLVQKSVAMFLKKRNIASGKQLKKLRKQYREEIVHILERF